MSERILVTGGAGFIGSFVCDLLAAEGYDVVAVDKLDPQVHPAGQWPAWRNPRVEYHLGDCTDPALWRAWLPRVGAVIHLAAVVGVGQSQYQVAHYVRNNVMGTALMLDEVVNGGRRPRKLIVASSNTIYGEGRYRRPDGGDAYPRLRPAAQLRRREWELRDADGAALAPAPTPESKPLDCTTVYAITKRDQEEAVLAIGQAYGVPAVALRFFGVCGPRQSLSNPYTGVAAIFLSRLRNRRAPLVFEDGRQTRDFVSVRDVAAAVVRALETDAADGLAVNVGTGEPHTVLEVAEMLNSLLGTAITPEVTGEFRAGDIRHCYADNRLLRERLGYAPRWSLRDALEEVVEWGAHAEAHDAVEAAAAELRDRGLLA